MQYPRTGASYQIRKAEIWLLMIKGARELGKKISDQDKKRELELRLWLRRNGHGR